MLNNARACQTCGATIPAFTTAYTLRLQLFAEGGEIHITPDDLAEDHERRLLELYREAECADPQEMMDEVFESYTLTICERCRHEFHDHFMQFLKSLKDTI
ncbi:MAG: hypothetical protein NTW86_05070 [Candidatus Sumerlaeota bacterium]|nr:hypothetical protein [Candidatus Sumerlaeota bacterium]